MNVWIKQTKDRLFRWEEIIVFQSLALDIYQWILLNNQNYCKILSCILPRCIEKTHKHILIQEQFILG